MISSLALVARRRSLVMVARGGESKWMLGSADSLKIRSSSWGNLAAVAHYEALGRGGVRIPGFSVHTLSTLLHGTTRDDDDDDDDGSSEIPQSHIRLRSEGIPRTQVLYVSSSSSSCRQGTSFPGGLRWSQQQKRGVITAIDTTMPSKKSSSPMISPGSKEVHSASLSSSSSSSPEDGQGQNHRKKSLGELYEDHTARYRIKAVEMRDNARESWGEFKEHPGASMKSGATSFGEMMKKYGPVFLGVHITVYFATLGALFVGIDTGSMDPMNLMSLLGHGGSSDTDAAVSETKNTVELVVHWMKGHSWSSGMAPYVEQNPHIANLAVAWIIVKFTEPVRLPVSIFLTPRVARYMGKNEEDTQVAKTESSTSTTTASTTTTTATSTETDGSVNSSKSNSNNTLK